MNKAKPNTVSVLIVEDDVALRVAYETVLTIEGFITTVAGDGQEGLSIASQTDFDVILLDMLMPNFNGLEFLREYKGGTQHPKTKIIVFSNMSVPSEVRVAMELGASKYLTKSSFTPKEIISIIEDVVAGE